MKKVIQIIHTRCWKKRRSTGVGKGKMGLKKEENITQQGRETLEKD